MVSIPTQYFKIYPKHYSPARNYFNRGCELQVQFGTLNLAYNIVYALHYPPLLEPFKIINAYSNIGRCPFRSIVAVL